MSGFKAGELPAVPNEKARKRQIAAARRSRQGFVSTYHPELAVRIIERLAEGETLSAICREDGMPDRGTFRRWLSRDEKLREAYLAAREVTAHSIFDEVLDITRQLKAGEKMDNARVNALRVALDNLRWAAGKLNPKEYGERATPGPAIAVQIITPLNLGASGKETGTGIFDNVYSLSAALPQPEPAGSNATDGDPGQSAPAEGRQPNRGRAGSNPFAKANLSPASE